VVVGCVQARTVHAGSGGGKGAGPPGRSGGVRFTTRGSPVGRVAARRERGPSVDHPQTAEPVSVELPLDVLVRVRFPDAGHDRLVRRVDEAAAVVVVIVIMTVAVVVLVVSAMVGLDALDALILHHDVDLADPI